MEFNSILTSALKRISLNGELLVLFFFPSLHSPKPPICIDLLQLIRVSKVASRKGRYHQVTNLSNLRSSFDWIKKRKNWTVLGIIQKKQNMQMSFFDDGGVRATLGGTLISPPSTYYQHRYLAIQSTEALHTEKSHDA